MQFKSLLKDTDQIHNRWLNVTQGADKFEMKMHMNNH